MGPLGAIVSGHMNFRRGFLGCSIAPAAALIVTAVFPPSLLRRADQLIE
jgi:hypothetical protein